MNFFNQFPNDTKCIKLPIIIDINGILYLTDDLESILDETLEWDCKYLITINTSSGLPLTKDGVPFSPINFVIISLDYMLNNLGDTSSNPYLIIIDLGDDDNYDSDLPGKLKIEEDDIVNWPSLKIALEEWIRSSDLIKYDENISSNIDLSLVCTKIHYING